MVRMMPSVARVVNSIQSLIYGMPCVEVLSKELDNFEFQNEKVIEPSRREFKESFKMESVSYTYPDSDRESLIDASIEVRKGTCVGILGESGSGKSTLIDIALGLLKPKVGNIIIDGKIF